MLATPFSGITFRVNEVTPEGDPFEVVPSVDTINDYLQPPAWLTEEVQRNTSATLDEKQHGDLQSADLAKKSTPKIETCSRPRGELCSGMSCHLLVNVIAAACRSHRPVVLSPDMIWLTICQGVSHHVNQHSERFRKQLVDHSSEANRSPTPDSHSRFIE
ncbi:MAG: DUF4419 domain-containing protein [Planctomycetaceae bacterium]